MGGGRSRRPNKADTSNSSFWEDKIRRAIWLSPSPEPSQATCIQFNVISFASPSAPLCIIFGSPSPTSGACKDCCLFSSGPLEAG